MQHAVVPAANYFDHVTATLTRKIIIYDDNGSTSTTVLRVTLIIEKIFTTIIHVTAFLFFLLFLFLFLLVVEFSTRE